MFKNWNFDWEGIKSCVLVPIALVLLMILIGMVLGKCS